MPVKKNYKIWKYKKRLFAWKWDRYQYTLKSTGFLVEPVGLPESFNTILEIINSISFNLRAPSPSDLLYLSSTWRHHSVARLKNKSIAAVDRDRVEVDVELKWNVCVTTKDDWWLLYLLLYQWDVQPGLNVLSFVQ